MNADFSKLYSELGVQPACSLNEFKLAYRRRVAELHPDRTANDQTAHQLPIEELNALYAQAMRFSDRYGRLPGSAALPAKVERARKSHNGDLSEHYTSDFAHTTGNFSATAQSSAPSSNKARRDWILIGLSIALVALFAFVE